MTAHVHAGRLDGIHAEVGTILGPKAITREYVTVTGNDETGITVGYARTGEIEATAIAAMAIRDPQSVTEHQMVSGHQFVERLALRRLFGPSDAPRVFPRSDAAPALAPPPG